MSNINTPGFTAEFSFRKTSERYQYAATRGYSSGEDVRLALMNDGGGGSNFWCDDDGTCSCLGGSLSDDCWTMRQYCTSELSCSPYFPYKCSCYYTLTRPPQIGRGDIGTIGAIGTRLFGP